MEVAMAEEARIKALAVPTRPVGETFDFEEATIESEISWVRTTKFSTKLILTNVVDPATGKKKTLYCTPRPTPSSQHEVIFNDTRWADVTSYGLVPGKTILNNGAPLTPPLPPASSAPKYNLVTQMPDPTEFTSDFSQYRIFFAKDDRWHIGNITSCTISTGRTAAFWVEVSVNMKQIASTARMDLLEEPEAFNFRVLHSQYLGSGELKHRASGNWFLNEYGLSHILSEARPGQGVTSLEDAWSTFLLQRAVIVFNGVLIFHDYTTDPSRTKKTGKRIDTINYKKNGIMKLRRYNGGGQSEEEMQEESAGGEERGADEEDMEDEGDSEDSDDSDGEGEEDEERWDGAESEGDEDWAEAGRGNIGGGYVSIAPGARTGGIMQAIVDSVTVRQLLPPSGFCLYSNAVLDMEYGQLAWPSLSWDVVNSCRLMRFPDLTIGNASDIPVNNCIKVLSLAAAIGRPPTCTAGCMLLTPAEVQLVLKRCKGAARVDDPEHARTPKPPITLRGALPASLAHLVWDYDLKTRREVVDSWTLVRAEIACKAADVGVREEQYTAASINNINCAARYLFHTAKYFNTTAEAGEQLASYFTVLHKQQKSYQQFWRNHQAAEHSANITGDIKLRKGRLVDTVTATWEYVNDRMIGVMLDWTWGPFQGAIDKWLKDNGKSWADLDLDALGDILVNGGKSDNFGTNRGKKPGASHLTGVDWVQELAAYLRETVKVNLYDCCNLELLTHLLAYMEKPVRQQDVWHNRASLVFAKIINGEIRLFLTIDSPTNKKSMGKGKGRAGNLNGPLPTSIPLPKELICMFLISLFVCRTMRLQVQQSESTKAADRAKPVPDFVIGLYGNSNRRMGKKTFTNILTKLGMCHFAIPRWGPYSIRNQWVSDMFLQAHNIEVTRGMAKAQEYLANAMHDIHSSLDAAITNYNQTLNIQYASCLRPSKYQRVNDGYGREATASASDSVSSGGGSGGGGISSWGADTYGGGTHAMPCGKDMLILQQRQTAAMEQMAAATTAAQATSAATQATLAAVAMVSTDIIGTWSNREAGVEAWSRMTTLVPADVSVKVAAAKAADAKTNAEFSSSMYDQMMDIMVKGTYHPFTKAINSWLVTKGMSMKDLDNLTSVLAPKFHWDHDDDHHQVDASRFSEVPWVPELAQHLLDTGFNLFDCFNLELLVHIAVFSDCPMRDQDFWNTHIFQDVRTMDLSGKHTAAHQRLIDSLDDIHLDGYAYVTKYNQWRDEQKTINIIGDGMGASVGGSMTDHWQAQHAWVAQQQAQQQAQQEAWLAQQKAQQEAWLAQQKAQDEEWLAQEEAQQEAWLAQQKAQQGAWLAQQKRYAQLNVDLTLS
ncbi:hypothetical protein JKP88DRAFT_280038 [Tribonema minus]|uniref:Uncharacterized protein n=1 Tax=Tribonema minus TaxID=303371 RepID=A0A835Z0H7_9STRA|nr:hypothetical protein JKP88DRAFT_280038 [Tribonema minus]